MEKYTLISYDFASGFYKNNPIIPFVGKPILAIAHNQAVIPDHNLFIAFERRSNLNEVDIYYVWILDDTNNYFFWCPYRPEEFRERWDVRYEFKRVLIEKNGYL